MLLLMMRALFASTLCGLRVQTVMGDHLALLVDHLLTESTFESTIGSQNQALTNPASLVVPIEGFNQKKKKKMKKGGKLVECRICQEEDEAINMEIPCSCCGSLKYAHRKCVQRWCNEKGDTTCEICLQLFKPGYIAPPPLFHCGSIPMNFRGSWEILSRDLNDSQIITMVPSDRDFTDSSDFDFYSASNTRSTICCRSVAIIFTTLLVLRHSLPLMIDEAEDYSITHYSLLVFRTLAILVPIAIMVRAFIIFHRRRRQDARDIPISGSNEESLSLRSTYQPQQHLIRVR